MTRRQIARRAFDAEHRRLLLAVRTAPSGQKQRAKDALRAYVTKLLGEAAAIPRRTPERP